MNRLIASVFFISVSFTSGCSTSDTRTALDNGNEEWTYFMNNNQFDATTFIPIVGLLTGGSQTQAKRLEIEFKDETVTKWTFSENNSKMKTGLIQ